MMGQFATRIKPEDVEGEVADVVPGIEARGELQVAAKSERELLELILIKLGELHELLDERL